jgi:transcriptional regulator with XRE-family HTH domain
MHLVFDAERLRQECDRHGLTAQKLAERAECSVSAVYRWRNGRAHPGANQLAAIALAMGLPLESFYSVTPAPGSDEDMGTSVAGAA